MNSASKLHIAIFLLTLRVSVGAVDGGASSEIPVYKSGWTPEDHIGRAKIAAIDGAMPIALRVISASAGPKGQTDDPRNQNKVRLVERISLPGNEAIALRSAIAILSENIDYLQKFLKMRYPGNAEEQIEVDRKYLKLLVAANDMDWSDPPDASATSATAANGSDAPTDSLNQSIAAAQARLDHAGTDAEKKDAALALESLLKQRDPDAWVDYPGRPPQPAIPLQKRREAVLETIYNQWMDMELSRAIHVHDDQRAARVKKLMLEFTDTKTKAHFHPPAQSDLVAYEAVLSKAEAVLDRWEALVDAKNGLSEKYKKNEAEIMIISGYLGPRAMHAETETEWENAIRALVDALAGGVTALKMESSEYYPPISKIIDEVESTRKPGPTDPGMDQSEP